MSKFIINFRWFLLTCLFSIRTIYSESEVFSQEFIHYLRNCAETAEELTLVERILDLNINSEEAVIIVSKIPFISTAERKTLLELLYNRRREFLKQLVSTDAEGQYGFVVLGDETERRLILKRYIYSVLRTEEEYETIRELFAQQLGLADILTRLEALHFFRSEELRLAGRIVSGRLEAYYQSVSDATYIYSQQLEVSTVELRGHERDLLAESGFTGRYRHQLRSTGSSFGRDFFADMALEVGNQPGRESDRAMLESISMKWAGAKDQLEIGDIYDFWHPYVLNRNIRGFRYSRRYSSTVPAEVSVFGGIAEELVFDPLGSDYMSTNVVGFNLLKDADLHRKWQMTMLYADEAAALGDRQSSVLALSHQANLSDQVDFKGSLAFSYGNRWGLERQRGGAFDAGFYYADSVHSGEFSLAGASDHFFSLLGENNAAFTAMHGQFRRQECWGSYLLAFDHEKEFAVADYLRAASSLRPYFMLGLSNVGGIKNFSLDYYYGENQEESADKWLLSESNTHRFSFLRAFRGIHFDGSYQYTRTYDKIISRDYGEEKNARLGLRGFWASAAGYPITPGVFVQQENRRIQTEDKFVKRRGLGMDVQGSLGRQSRFTADFLFWENQAPLYFSLHTKTAGMSVYHALSEEWDKSWRFDWRWEEQNLADGLSYGSANRLTLAYVNSF